MKIRTDISANYRAVFFNGKTIRQRIDNPNWYKQEALMNIGSRYHLG